MRLYWFLLGVFLSMVSIAFADNLTSVPDRIRATGRMIMQTAWDPDGNPSALKVDKDGKVIAHCE